MSLVSTRTALEVSVLGERPEVILVTPPGRSLCTSQDIVLSATGNFKKFRKKINPKSAFFFQGMSA